MASALSFSYQKLSHEGRFQDGEEDEGLVLRPRSWRRFRRVPSRRRFKLRIPSLRRFLRRRRVNLASAGRVFYAKIWKRFKESQIHFGDLFAGNYLFMQVNPTPIKVIQKSWGRNHPSGCSFPGTV